MKNLMTQDPEHHLKSDQLWPREAPELVARYNRHLGLDLPQPPTRSRQQDRSRDEGWDL